MCLVVSSIYVKSCCWFASAIEYSARIKCYWCRPACLSWRREWIPERHAMTGRIVLEYCPRVITSRNQNLAHSCNLLCCREVWTKGSKLYLTFLSMVCMTKTLCKYTRASQCWGAWVSWVQLASSRRWRRTWDRASPALSERLPLLLVSAFLRSIKKNNNIWLWLYSCLFWKIRKIV